MRKQSARNESQGVFFVDSMSIPDEYSLERAQQAARRRQLRIGNIARIAGFNRRTNGLFVPHSGTENSAIVQLPENKLKVDTDSAKQRVYEKYKDSEDVSTKQVDLWAYFSGNNAYKGITRKYRQFRDESLTNSARIGSALIPLNGEISREVFTFNPDYRIDSENHTTRDDILAYNSVLKYFIDLEAFTGENPNLIGKNGQRKWAQMRHTHAYKERMERVHAELEPLADDLFAERVDEAYWSHYSRGRFWVGVIKQHEAYKQHKRQQDNLRLGSLPPDTGYIESLTRLDRIIEE